MDRDPSRIRIEPKSVPREILVHDSRQAGELAGRLREQAPRSGLLAYRFPAQSIRYSDGISISSERIESQVLKPTEQQELTLTPHPQNVLQGEPGSSRENARTDIITPSVARELQQSHDLYTGFKGLEGPEQFERLDTHKKSLVQAGNEDQTSVVQRSVKDTIQKVAITNEAGEGVTRQKSESIADMVYDMMRRDLLVERDRRGWSRHSPS